VLRQVRDLDWLWLFLVSWVAPFVVDGVSHLTYVRSLLFWLVPAILLLPRFLEYTDPGGRRRAALWTTTAGIVGLGILLDCVFGRIILQFDESPTADYIGWLRLPQLGVNVPFEEFLFYAMAPIAILFVYVWASEYWLAFYTPRFQATDTGTPAVEVSMLAIALSVVMLFAGIVIFHRNAAGTGPVPAYYTFLVVLALAPAVLLFSRMRRFVNWRAFGVTTLYVLMTSLIWEATLAVPRHWWGYKPSAMLGWYVNAWTQNAAWPFPIEAVFVWVACPFSCILTYEFVKFRGYQANPSKPTYLRLSLDASSSPSAAPGAGAGAVRSLLV
jgi:hypothetical protein